MRRLSRYLATVRRAIVIPFSCSLATSSWSLSGGHPTSLQAAYWGHAKRAVYITSVDDGTVFLHDLSDYRKLVTLLSKSPVLGADLIGVQDQVVSAHADGQLRIWKLNRD